TSPTNSASPPNAFARSKPPPSARCGRHWRAEIKPPPSLQGPRERAFLFAVRQSRHLAAATLLTPCRHSRASGNDGIKKGSERSKACSDRREGTQRSPSGRRRSS